MILDNPVSLSLFPIQIIKVQILLWECNKKTCKIFGLVQLLGIKVKYFLRVSSLAQLIIKADAYSFQGQKLHPEYDYDQNLKHFMQPTHTLKNADQLFKIYMLGNRK